MPEWSPANHNKSHKTPSERETFGHSNFLSNTFPTYSVPIMHQPFQFYCAQNFPTRNFPDPLLHSVLPSQEEASQNGHLLSVPPLLNLETSGLRQSPRIAALNDTTQDGSANVAYTSSTTQPHSRWIARPKPQLFFSVFTSVGARWNFATLIPHSDNECLSFVAKMQMISNKSMAPLMTGLMIYVFIFRHIQPQTNASGIPKCCVKMIG